MRPLLRGSIRFRAASVPFTVPRYVTSVTLRNSSGVISLTGENTDVIALLTHTSMGPRSSSVLSAAASTASASETSVRTTSALPPAGSTSVLAPSSPSRPRARRPTRAPRLAKATAVARPTPAEAPVITTSSGVPFCLSMRSHPSIRWPRSFAPQKLGAVEPDPRSGRTAARVFAREGHHVRPVLLVKKEEPHLQGLSDLEIVRAASCARKVPFLDPFENPPFLVFGKLCVLADDHKMS